MGRLLVRGSRRRAGEHEVLPGRRRADACSPTPRCLREICRSADHRVRQAEPHVRCARSRRRTPSAPHRREPRPRPRGSRPPRPAAGRRPGLRPRTRPFDWRWTAPRSASRPKRCTSRRHRWTMPPSAPATMMAGMTMREATATPRTADIQAFCESLIVRGRVSMTGATAGRRRSLVSSFSEARKHATHYLDRQSR